MVNRIVATLAVASVFVPGVSFAQQAVTGGAESSLFDRSRAVSVKERPRPDFDALGIRAGAFLVYPKVEASVASDDNVFATETNEESDVVTSIAPSISAVSQWSRHEVQAFARGNAYRYNEFPAQDAETYSVGASGRLDVVRRSSLRGSVGYDYLVEPRSSASSPQGSEEPVRYSQTSVDVGGVHEFNRLRLRGDARYRNYRFRDARTFTGVVIDESYRDNSSWEVQGRADYALSPALAVYGTAVVSKWEFANPTVAGDVRRDSDGVLAAVGTDFEVSKLMRGQVQVGYFNQAFDDNRVGDVDGLGLYGRLEYFPTDLLTVTASGERSVVATGVIGAGGVVRTSGGLQGDYELLRNLILTAKAQMTRDDYRGVNREDDIWTAMVGGYYLINRRVGVNVIYNHYNQKSGGVSAGPDFAINRIQLGLVVQY